MDDPKKDPPRGPSNKLATQQHQQRKPVGRKIVSFLIPGENDPRLSSPLASSLSNGDTSRGRHNTTTAANSQSSPSNHGGAISGILKSPKRGGGSQHSQRSFLRSLSSGGDSSSMGDTPSSSSYDSREDPKKKQFLSHEHPHGPDDGSIDSIEDTRRTSDDFSDDGGMVAASGAIQDITRAVYSFRTAQHISLTRVKLFVMAILAISTVIVVTGVWLVSSRFEHDEFVRNYDVIAEQVINGLRHKSYTLFNAMDLFVTNIESVSQISYVDPASGTTSSSWPLVTIPDFAIRASKLQRVSDSAILHVGQYHLVHAAQREQWESYVSTSSGWIRQSSIIQEDNDENPINYNNLVVPTIHFVNNSTRVPDGAEFFLPQWQAAPVVVKKDGTTSINADGRSTALELALNALLIGSTVMGPVANLPPVVAGVKGYGSEEEIIDMNRWLSVLLGSEDSTYTEPVSSLYHPIFELGSNNLMGQSGSNANDDKKVNGPLLGVFSMVIQWRRLLMHSLPESIHGLDAVIDNGPCGQIFTYRIQDDNSVDYVGPGDHHDGMYEYLEETLELQDLFQDLDLVATGLELTEGACPYSIRLYPSYATYEESTSGKPRTLTMIAAGFFVVFGMLLLLNDWLIRISHHALWYRVREFVSPNLIYRLGRTSSDSKSKKKQQRPKDSAVAAEIKACKAEKSKEECEDTPAFQRFLDGSNSENSSPCAEKFPETTVMFGDIIGFTIWSKSLDPTKVFQFLEVIYGSFDSICEERGILHVKTVGDAYVAVSGLPEKRDDHALVMAQCARDCQCALGKLTEQWEPILGHKTRRLQLRVGLHSGPVYAGVLRGQSVRFHVLGETIDEAMRMQVTSMPNRIHCSKTTASWLRADGLDHWLQPREEPYPSRTLLKSFWVVPTPFSIGGSSAPASTTMDISMASSLSPTPSFETMSSCATEEFSQTLANPSLLTMAQKSSRLIDWNIDVLSLMLRNLMAKHAANEYQETEGESDFNPDASKYLKSNGGYRTLLEEAVEVIEMPELEAREFFKRSKVDLESIELSTLVQSQLRSFVSAIASLYHDHPFHNFGHATHTSMSLTILLSRMVVNSSSDEEENEDRNEDNFMKALSNHNRTFGICSDPLAQFAMVFAALMHNIDHPGVSNRQLIRESSPLVKKFGGRSTSQLNSIQRGWELFAQDIFRDLRRAICPTTQELQRFRQLFVTCIIATDYEDIELNNRRNGRWKRAFGSLNKSTKGQPSMLTSKSPLFSKDSTDIMATLVIEELLQASALSHTMQHFHVYRKWNSNLFEERRSAYLSGRTGQDPSLTWYQEQLNFFDNVAVPLAQKLCNCGMLGEFSNEYLSYARMNRDEWQRRGQKEVSELLERVNGSSIKEGMGGPNNTTIVSNNGSSKETTEPSILSLPGSNQGSNVLHARNEETENKNEDKKMADSARETQQHNNLTTILETADEASKSVSSVFSGDTTIQSLETLERKEDIPTRLERPKPDDADDPVARSLSNSKVDRAESPTPSILSVSSDKMEQPGLNFMSYDKMMSNSILRKMTVIEEPKSEDPGDTDQMDQPEQPGIKFVSRSSKMVDMLGRVNEPIFVIPISSSNPSEASESTCNGQNLSSIQNQHHIDPKIEGKPELAINDLSSRQYLDMIIEDESTIRSWRPIIDSPDSTASENSGKRDQGDAGDAATKMTSADLSEPDPNDEASQGSYGSSQSSGSVVSV